MSLARRNFRRLRREGSLNQSVTKMENQVGGQGPSSVLVEVVESILLAIVAVMTAWSGYESSLWDSRSAASYELSSKLQSEAQSKETLAGQQALYDATTFSAWLQATQSGNTALAGFMERRFRPEYLPAFRAWLATDPFHNTSAPPGPAVMPQYRLAAQAQADKIRGQAATSIQTGDHSRDLSDQYVRITVLLAVVLFLTAVSQRFSIRRVRMAIVGLALVVLGYSAFALVTIGS